MTSIHELDATTTLGLYQAKELSPTEVINALIERVERHEPVINSVCDRRFDEAIAEARAATERYARGEARALEGLAVAAKEEHPMRGRLWQQGSLTLADTVADVDHPIIERIQQAGGIIHVRTTTPEFCCAGFCHSRLWGTTRNPWHTDYSPGGSSGGTGAALAAGYAAVGTGSDIGGSIRIPASFSGIVGYKAPFGTVPALPPYNLDQFCHDGAMGRTLADTALLHNVIAGPHRLDQVAVRNPLRLPSTPEAANGMRVALCINLGEWPVDEAVERNTRNAAAALADAGVEIEEVTLPWPLDRLWEAAQAHFQTIMGAGITSIAERYGDHLSDYTLAFAASMTSSLSFYEGLELEGALYEPLGALFESFDALLCPTMAIDGFRAGHPYLEPSVAVGNGTVSTSIQAAMTWPFNIFSRCPVFSVPSGKAANGVPTGVQVVGRTHDELTAYRLAAALEHVLSSRGIGFASPQWRPTLD
jgi:Asp-tRNA(Asn)/Glu-tRNA(Gln) amidotransferase A subunit family amidase